MNNSPSPGTSSYFKLLGVTEFVTAIEHQLGCDCGILYQYINALYSTAFLNHGSGIQICINEQALIEGDTCKGIRFSIEVNHSDKAIIEPEEVIELLTSDSTNAIKEMRAYSAHLWKILQEHFPKSSIARISGYNPKVPNWTDTLAMSMKVMLYMPTESTPPRITLYSDQIR